MGVFMCACGCVGGGDIVSASRIIPSMLRTIYSSSFFLFCLGGGGG